MGSLTPLTLNRLIPKRTFLKSSYISIYRIYLFKRTILSMFNFQTIKNILYNKALLRDTPSFFLILVPWSYRCVFCDAHSTTMTLPIVMVEQQGCLQMSLVSTMASVDFRISEHHTRITQSWTRHRLSHFLPKASCASPPGKRWPVLQDLRICFLHGMQIIEEEGLVFSVPKHVA